MRPAWLVLAALAAGLSAGSQAAGAAEAQRRDSLVSTVIVVRHADKNTMFVGTDPPLSEAGVRRVAALAHVLRDVELDAVYSTPWKRNLQTAAPLAARLRDSVRVTNGDPVELVRRIRSEHPAGTVLVIGHSDTVPAIVEALAGVKVPDFRAGEYDRLYVVTLENGRPPRVLALRYGEPAPE